MTRKASPSETRCATLVRKATIFSRRGVLVLSPLHHREIFEHVYRQYEDKGGPGWNYEMRPLSFEIQERSLQHLIDARFNVLLGFWLERMVFYQNRRFTSELQM